MLIGAIVANSRCERAVEWEELPACVSVGIRNLCLMFKVQHEALKGSCAGERVRACASVYARYKQHKQHIANSGGFGRCGGSNWPELFICITNYSGDRESGSINQISRLLGKAPETLCGARVSCISFGRSLRLLFRNSVSRL